jgi:hypothetical protein
MGKDLPWELIAPSLESTYFTSWQENGDFSEKMHGLPVFGMNEAVS